MSGENRATKTHGSTRKPASQQRNLLGHLGPVRRSQASSRLDMNITERRDLHKTWLWAVLGILSLALVWWTLTPNINETEQVTKVRSIINHDH